MENPVKKKSFSMDWLLSPWAVFGGILIGTFIGIRFKEFALQLTPFGEIFLSLLQMCILPILITAVISSLGRMIRAGQARHYIGWLLFIFVSGLLTASLVGVLTGLIARPGSSLDDHSRVVLGKLVSQQEMTMNPGSADESHSPSLVDFFKKMVPANIFAAFSHGQNLAILFFCILLGISLGFVHSEAGDVALTVSEALYDAFQKLISWVMYALPFGLCALFASQISQVGLEVLSALMRFVILCYIAVFIMMILYNVIIWIRTGGSFLRPFVALRETLVVALGTSSSFAAIPSALRCLQDNFKVKRSTANLVIPLGVNLNPQGSVLHFALSTVFIAQIYQVSLGAQGWIIAIVGSVLAGMAATGVPGAGSLAMIALVLEPLGLPSQAAIILLLAIDPMIDPILTVNTIHANCTAAVLVSDRAEQAEQAEKLAGESGEAPSS
jgi:Na+/H+-dicarboxylate symporter